MLRYVIALLALFWLASPAAAEERILSFLSDVTVNRDSSLAVVETITVNAEGDRIRRGIFRDFPTRYVTLEGTSMEVGFEAESVRRDGQSEPYGLEDIANGVRVRIGSRDVFLSPGSHTYEISYRTTRQLGFFADYDEIYWNVTGNSWEFAIDEAAVAIHLPEGAAIRQHAAYTGPQGAQGKDFTVLAAEGGLYRAATSRALSPGEGFTVAVGFTKGIVVPPPPPPDTTRQSYMALGGGVLAMLAYYFFAWFRVGRDPKGTGIIPLFAAPPELGPAGVRYVWRHGFDEKTFAAGVIGLAAKGRFKIKVNDGYTITKLKGDGAALTLGEAQMLKAHPGGDLEIKDKNHVAIHGMRRALEETLERDYGASTYRTNRGWFWGGIPLSLAALIPAFYFIRPEDLVGAFVVGVFFALLWAFFVWLLYLDVRAFLKPGIGRKIATGLGFLILLGLMLALSLAIVAVLTAADSPRTTIYAAGFAAMVAMHLLFLRWLTAPTQLGRKLMDQIEGLRLYMTTAEEKRLDMLNPPEKTPELFERLLPYALALDCENQWSEKFASVLAAASYVGPAWYVGSGQFDSNDFGNLSGKLGSSQYDHTVRTSSSSYSPGSSSGSSGGGSSGGGGGGGGGGGW